MAIYRRPPRPLRVRLLGEDDAPPRRGHDPRKTAAENAGLEGVFDRPDEELDWPTEAAPRMARQLAREGRGSDTEVAHVAEKDYGVSGTLQSVNLAGREDELLRLRMKKGLELRRDMEVVLHSNQAKVTDSGSTARLLGGLPTWITNNVGVDVSAGNGDGSSAVKSSGTPALTYEYLASAHQLAFVAGGAPNLLEVPPSLTRKFSQLAFSATPSTADVRYEAKANSPAVAIGSVDKWLSDFGTIDVVVNRQLAIQAGSFLKQAAFLIDSEHVSVAMLRSFEVNKLAKTGDATSEFVVSEYTLAPDAPNAHAAAYGMI